MAGTAPAPAIPAVAEAGPATRALLGMVRGGVGEKELAGRICAACAHGLGVDGAALSLLTGSESRVTLASTDPVAQRLEELQFTFNEGACMEAAMTGRPVLVSDLHHSNQTTRWPLFAGAVAEQTRVSALFAWPLQWGAVNLGVLDLYRVAAGPLDADQLRDAAAAVNTAALLILGRRTDPAGRFPGREPADWLDEVADYRAEIHQATGMVLAQLEISATDALARMRGHAFIHQRLLVDVARDVVGRRLVFTHDMS